MLELKELYSASWGVEPWLVDSWKVLNDEERQQVKQRLDELFANGLPLTIKHDKVLYLHLFAMLTQLEVLGIQTPLKFESRMTRPDFRARMRQQLTDEVFHTLVFTKISYALAAPYAMPPTYNKHVDRFCQLISGEEDTQMAVLLTNLIAEGFIEETFEVLQRHGISPHVFAIILEDEQRHISDIEVYRELGMPKQEDINERLVVIEEELITNVFFQPITISALNGLTGIDGCRDLLSSIDKKYQKQLASLSLKPSEKWGAFVQFAHNAINDIEQRTGLAVEIEPTSTRRALMSQWQEPTNPTMSSIISIDVSKLCFFEKKFPAETINCLVMQAISKIYAETPAYRRMMRNHRLYQLDEVQIALAISLPEHSDHLGMIEFADCHDVSLLQMGADFKHDMQIMAYCYAKFNQLLQQYPHLHQTYDELFNPGINGVFGLGGPERSFVTVSNIGSWGFELGVSPLMPGEILKFTLTQVERKQVWNNQTKAFEIQDRLPIGISVDHRVFDGNNQVARDLQKHFDIAFDKFIADLASNKKPKLKKQHSLEQFIKNCDKALEQSLEYTFRFLVIASHYWRSNNSLVDLLHQDIESDRFMRELLAEKI